MKTEKNEMNELIQKGKLEVDKLVKEIKLRRAITQVAVTAIYVGVVVGIFLVVKELDGSLPKE